MSRVFSPVDPFSDPLVVHRSTLRTWLISLAGIPAIVAGVDVLWRQRIVGWLTERIFGDEPQTLEARDEIWAWALLVVGVAVVVWGLKELFFPAPVLRTDEEGVHLRLSGPFRPPTSLSWDSLHDVDAATLEDDGDMLDVLVVEVNQDNILPANPWAARSIGPRTVAIYAEEWDAGAEEVARRLVDQAVKVAKRRPREAEVE